LTILNVPDQWNQYFTKYPQGYTILEALLNWVQQVGDMVDDHNTMDDTIITYGNRLDDFIAQFDTNLHSEVTSTLSEWQTSGFLEIVIDSNLQTKIDNVSAQSTIQSTRIDNLVANAGNVANNAELLDIRVGADGKTYSGAGVAVRTQLANLNTLFPKTANLFDPSLASVGYFYDQTKSTPTLSANAAYTAYIFDADPSTTYTVTGSSFYRTDFNASGAKVGSWDMAENAPYTFTTQPTTAKVALSFKHGNYPIGTYMIVKSGTLPTVIVKKGNDFSKDVHTGKKKTAITVKKDGSGDFIKVYDAIKHAQNVASADNVYDILIYDTSTDHKGTAFDILAEMGGTTYLATITDTTNNQKGLPLTDYMNLIGVGKVKLFAYLPDTVTLAQSTCFSTVEGFGEFYCENLTFEVKNGRYPFHDESNNSRPNKQHRFNKCKFVHLGNGAGLWSAPHAYAAGTSGGNIYDFKDCVFDSAASGGYPWDLHNYAPQRGSSISMEGCKMIKSASQPTSIKLGFNGYSPVTTDPIAYEACYNNVFIKNILADGLITVGPEVTTYNCTNNYRLYNFTALQTDIKPDLIL
jgi:hypothetical protein